MSAPSRDLVDAVVALDPQPRAVQYRSLTSCVVDAVWSINANYDMHVLPTVRTVATDLGHSELLGPASGELGPDPAPLPRFLDFYPDGEALADRTTRHRTSTRNGILKADAARQYAAVLVDHGLEERPSATAAITDPAALKSVELDLSRVKGHGHSGVRLGYLWMLLGADDVIKPDRMVMRWLRDHGVDVTPSGARELLVDVATRVSNRIGRPVTAWEVDHAIWKDARQPRMSRSRK